MSLYFYLHINKLNYRYNTKIVMYILTERGSESFDLEAHKQKLSPALIITI